MSKTKEPQYAPFLDLRDKKGFARFGLMSNQTWHDDPKRLAFLLSRYKFVAKMLSGKKRVLEIGCADGFASRVVRQEVGHLSAIDFDPIFIDDAQNYVEERWPIDFAVHDMLTGPFPGEFDGAYCIDVLEHIAPENEAKFLQNICASLTNDTALIVGIPPLESQEYASEISRLGHVNCKKAPDLKMVMQQYFDNVFIFSMNDEVVHTGFTPLAHYVFALCCGKKSTD
ncbi:MAG: class I SAM-dependent methyltransferase [Rhodospirillales bacterium]|nr:class I SAM-dependent methyltransferase [Rhodospirillales bacterium]